LNISVCTIDVNDITNANMLVRNAAEQPLTS